MASCKARLLSFGVDWCTGQAAPLDSAPRVLPQPEIDVNKLDMEACTYAKLPKMSTSSSDTMRTTPS